MRPSINILDILQSYYTLHVKKRNQNEEKERKKEERKKNK
jgi:hypothetical protein